MAGLAQPGFSTFDATATYLLRRAGVKGSRVVQVGCNIGGEVCRAQLPRRYSMVGQWLGAEVTQP